MSDSGFKIDNPDKSTEAQGYTVRQHQAAQDQDLNAMPTGTPKLYGDLGGEVQEREFRENEKLKDARRRIMEILEEDDGEQPMQQQQRRQPQMTGRVRRKNALGLDDLMEGLSDDDLSKMGYGIDQASNRAAVDLFQAGYMEDYDEASMMAESNAGRPQQRSEDWTTKKAQARLRNQKTVPVWFVVNEATGMKINKPFRIQPPAERIATVLNITGNVNDPRVRQIQEDYDTHVSLMKQIRKARQLAESGDPRYKSQVRKLMTELEGVNVRLGI